MNDSRFLVTGVNLEVAGKVLPVDAGGSTAAVAFPGSRPRDVVPHSLGPG